MHCRVSERTPPRRYTATATATPMTATTSCTSNSSQSIPLVAVGIPMARARKVPMTAATMPTTIVSQIGMFCRPGRISRARAPMTAPMTIAVMIPVMVMCFSIHVVVGG